MENKNLPSLFQLGDNVSVIFPGSGTLNPVRVIKISFTEKGDPLYDLEVAYHFYTEEDVLGKTGFARIHSIAEWHLRLPIVDALPASLEKKQEPA